MKYDSDNIRFCKHCNTELFFEERFEHPQKAEKGLNSFIANQLRHPTGIGGKLVFSVMNRQIRPLYEDVVQLLPLSDSDNVLDIGCGNGNVLNMLAGRSGGNFTGIDISPSAIKSALKHNRRYVKSRRMKFLCQDMNKMPFGDCSFNQIYTINTVYFWDNLDVTMSEIRRILKPEGLFINALFTNDTLNSLSHTKSYKRFTPEELIDAGASFTADIVPVFNGKAYCVLYRKG
jgi:ubiquinone/menaquinone biosynthesis C-methylase UbiE